MPANKVQRQRISFWCAAMTVATASIAIVPASAAQEGCVPRELVVSLLGELDGAADPLFVGTPAPGVLEGVPLPPGAVVIGGLSRERHLTVITASSKEGSQAGDEMASLLLSGGWKIREQNQQRGGFMASRRQQPALYCAPDGTMAHYSTRQRAGGGTLLMVSRIAKTPGYSPCTEDARRQMGQDGPMPALEPPAGVVSSYQGHGMGMGGTRSESVVLTTRDSPRNLAAHFSDQLVDQGWTLESDLVGDSMGSQMWWHTDAEGRAWRGLLLVATLADDTRDVMFSIAPRE